MAYKREQQRQDNRNDYIFQEAQPNSFSKLIGRYFRQFEIKVHAHSFRKSRLTDLYVKTKNIVLVRDYAGHADTKITERYVDVGGFNAEEIILGNANEESEIQPSQKVSS